MYDERDGIGTEAVVANFQDPVPDYPGGDGENK